jgi:SAM-dependent methyltransferase
MIRRLLLLWHRAKTRGKMDRVFSRGEDPYGYARSPYETARLEAMEAALGERCYARAVEVGCAEGFFTQRLAGRCEKVAAVDISPVALERARRRLRDQPGVSFHEADVRAWAPEGAGDLVVLGDVLYYLDKPMLGAEFEAVFPKIRGWLVPGGRLILAHGFAGPQELAHRRGFRERFERLGLRLVSETVVGEGLAGPVRCLLCVLEAP